MSENVGNLTPEVAELCERICGGLLQCRKQASLYPEGHPRVQNTLARLKENLAAYQRLTGQAFRLQVSDTFEGANDREGGSSTVPLALLLERRLVERIVLPAEVTNAELFRFCHVLRDDAIETPEKREQVLVELNQLDRIGLSFYEFRDLPPVVSDDEPDGPSRKVRRDDRFENIVSGLSPEVREPLREVLANPATTRRLHHIGSLLRNDRREPAGEQQNEVFLLREMVLAAVEASEGGPDDVVANFEDIVEFFEKHAGSLGASPSSPLSDADEEALHRELARYGAGATKTAEVVRKIQQEKQKLAELFHTRPAGPPPSASVKPDPSPEASRPAPAEEEEKLPADRPGPGELLSDVRYDLREIGRSIADAEPCVPYVQVVTDLLHRERTRESVLGNLSKVGKKIGAAVKSRRRFRQVLSAAASSFVQSDVQDSQELVLALLGKLESPTETLKVFETIVLPQCGDDLTERLLHTLTERDRKGAVRLLCLFLSSKEVPLRNAATGRLVTLSQNQALLLSWARKDPASLFRPDVFERIAEKIGFDRLYVCFREFFAGSTCQQAIDLIDTLPSALSGAEHVVLAATEHDSPAVRKFALTSFSRFPSPMVVTMLIEAVKRNNYERSDLDEIEGSLRALLTIGGPRVQEFLGEVRSGRGRFLRTYRRRIRRILRDLLRQEEERRS